jgi:hypothetical protein
VTSSVSAPAGSSTSRREAKEKEPLSGSTTAAAPSAPVPG